MSLELELDYDNTGLTVVVPWKLPEDLDNGTSEAKDKIEEIFNNKVSKTSKINISSYGLKNSVIGSS